MRCPKCGYISFDHLDRCLKCNKKVKKTADALHGTVFNVVPPSFLRFDDTEPEEHTEFNQEFDGDIDMNTVDPNLDILLDDESDTEDATDFNDLAEDDGFEISDDMEEEPVEEISIDFNQFEDADTDSESEQVLEIELPQELADLSDLEAQAPPVEENVIDASEEINENSLDAFADLEKDDFSFDLDLDLEKTENNNGSQPSSMAGEEELTIDELSLDEDFDSDKQLTLDDDLNFDLDLGGLSLEE